MCARGVEQIGILKKPEDITKKSSVFGACTVDDIEEQEEDSGVVNKGYGSILEPERQPVPRCVYTVAPPLSLGHTGILVMTRRAHRNRGWCRALCTLCFILHIHTYAEVQCIN